MRPPPRCPRLVIEARAKVYGSNFRLAFAWLRSDVFTALAQIVSNRSACLSVLLTLNATGAIDFGPLKHCVNRHAKLTHLGGL